MKPENSLRIKLVLSRMINNVVFDTSKYDKCDISIRLAQVEQVRFQTAGRRWVDTTHYMIH